MTAYRITGQRMAGIANQVRRLGKTDDMLTPERMEEILTGISTDTALPGDLPENAQVYYVGTAHTALNCAAINVENTASGVVLEESDVTE